MKNKKNLSSTKRTNIDLEENNTSDLLNNENKVKKNNTKKPVVLIKSEKILKEINDIDSGIKKKNNKPVVVIKSKKFFDEINNSTEKKDKKPVVIINKKQTNKKQKNDIDDHFFVKSNRNKNVSKKIVIKCESINKTIKTSSFSSKILDDINLEINEGEIVIILGPSGSGKTSLLNIISGIDKPSDGNVFIYDSCINKLSDKELTDLRREKISYIYQRYGLVPISTVFDNIKLGQNLVPIEKRKNIDFDYVVEKTGLTNYLNKFPHELSGGQKQRVSIARAILKQPKLMLCDEPTGALDDETSRKVIDLFLWINNEFKTTIVMVTHNNDLVKIADKIIYIKDGKISNIINRN